MREIKYHAVEKFGEVVKGGIDKDGDNRQFVFNKSGNIIERNQYNADGSLDYKYTSKFDENGNRIERNQYNADGSLNEKYTCKFDENGNTIEFKSHNSNGSLDYKSTSKFDENGNRIELIEFKGFAPEAITIIEIEYYD